jgi:hypothetical protein
MAAPLQAATLDIGATVAITANLLIGDGAPADDIDISTGFVTALSGDVDSAVNDPAATGSDNTFTQIGVLADPPTPYITTSDDATSLDDGGTARGFYYLESNIFPDPGPPPLQAVEFDRVVNATAALSFPDLRTDASAAGGFEISRDVLLTNTSATTSYAFPIAAEFDIALSASADDVGTESLAEAFFTLAFISSGEVGLSLRGPFDDDTGISASDPGTSATTDLVTSNELFDGVFLTASAAASGTGAPTLATLYTTSRFVMDTRMAPGSTLRVRFFQSPLASTRYDPPTMPPVPLPASVVVLLSGLAALGVARRTRRGRSI